MTGMADMMRAWRDRAWLDPADGYDGLDWQDVIEREGVYLYALSYNTPEAATGMVRSEKGREELAATWGKLRPADRQLYRKRADGAIDVAVKGTA